MKFLQEQGFFIVQRREIFHKVIKFVGGERVRGHAHLQPRPDGRRVMQKIKKPLSLHFFSFTDEIRRAETGDHGGSLIGRNIVIIDQPLPDGRLDGTAVLFDQMASLAIEDPRQFLAALNIKIARRARHDLRFRRVLHEPQQGGRDRFDLFIVELEIRHAQLFIVQFYFPLIKNARVFELLGEPGRAGMVDMDKPKIQPVHRTTALFGQFRADGLLVLKTRDSVARKTPVMPDQFLSGER